MDVAIQACAEWMASGNNACSGGAFAASQECELQHQRGREAVGRLLGADPNGISFGANMTSMTLAFTRAVAATLRPGDRVVGTKLDHDGNVTPWRIACEMSGAEHVLAPFDPTTGILAADQVSELIDERTKWVTLPGASNLLGTAPELAPMIAAAHGVGARVFIDAVALAPHHPIDVGALGCDALVTSPYKWYGPHSGAMYIEPSLLKDLPIAKLNASEGIGPSRFETGMPNYEAVAGIEAAARFLMEEGMEQLRAAENALFEPMLRGLQSIPGVRVFGPSGMEGRTPTAAFRIEGVSPADAAAELARDHIAVWDGHNYALGVVDQLGLAEVGGVVRAGVSRYLEPSDVDRLLKTVERVAARHR